MGERKHSGLSRETVFVAIGSAVVFVLMLGMWLFGDTFVKAFFGQEQYTVLSHTFAFCVAQWCVGVLVALLVATMCYIFYLRDILAERNTKSLEEQELIEYAISARQLQLLYDNSPVPYFVMDDAGNVRNANKATVRFFSAKPEDFQVANLYSLVVSVHRADPVQAVALLVSKVQRGISIADEEITFKTYSGEERIALMSVYSLESSSPLPFRHLVALRDVTKEREAEAVKTDFLLLASHQLRTPTTTIKWYIDYMLETKTLNLDGTVREYLGEIYTANERMMDLVSTLLTVSRIEMGTLAPEYSNVSFGAVVDDILDELSQDIVKKNITVTKDVVGEGSVLTDKTMMRIAIQNLFTNAVKYTPPGGSVYASVTYTPQGCEIVVKDTGCGIPMHEQNRIFSKMFRAGNAKKMSAQGTGLGLFLTKSFVEKLGGTITFESLEGKGSIFRIQLPRVAPGA